MELIVSNVIHLNRTLIDNPLGIREFTVLDDHRNMIKN